MAAGKGSRYGAQKQFDALGPNDEFLMEFSIHDALNCGFNHIVVVTQGSNVDYLKEYLANRLPKAIRLDVVAQTISDLPQGVSAYPARKKPWGTAHAVWCARDHIDGPFVVINADDHYGKTAFEKAALSMDGDLLENRFLLLGYQLKKTLSTHGSVSRGVCSLGHNATLERIREHTQLEAVGSLVVDHGSGHTFSGNELVSMNFWVCQPIIFNHLENTIRLFLDKGEDLERGEVYLPFAIQSMVDLNQIEVEVVPANEAWFGLTYQSDKEAAVRELYKMTEMGAYPVPLW